MIKIVLLTLVLINALGLMICDDPTNQNSVDPSLANAAMNANMLMANGNVMLDANGNPMRDANGNPLLTANGNTSMGANGNFGISNSTQPSTANPPTGVNPGTSTGNTAGGVGSTGGNTTGPDAGNMAPVTTPRR
jgi:hypothetical protein